MFFFSPPPNLYWAAAPPWKGRAVRELGLFQSPGVILAKRSVLGVTFGQLGTGEAGLWPRQ